MRGFSEIAKDALDLPPGQQRTLARILLDVSDDDVDFSPEAEAEWEDVICRRMNAVTTGVARSRSVDQVFSGLDKRFGT